MFQYLKTETITQTINHYKSIQSQKIFTFAITRNYESRTAGKTILFYWRSCQSF